MSDKDDQLELDFSNLNEPAPSRVGIVDADSITYNLGWYYAKADLLPQDYFNDTDTTVPDFIKTAVDTNLKKLREQMGVDVLHLHLTGSSKNSKLCEEFNQNTFSPQFRQLLGNTYKANRKSVPMPTGYHYTLRALLEQPNTYIHDQWEADEAVILHKKLNPTWVLSSNDKDVYKQHVGKNWLYDKRQKWVEIEKDFANYFPYLQAITGDPVDGFIGAKGIGEAGAKKFVSPDKTPADNWQGVVDAFASKGLSEEEAIMNMRFANMHQLKLDPNGNAYLDLWEPNDVHLQPNWV